MTGRNVLPWMFAALVVAGALIAQPQRRPSGPRDAGASATPSVTRPPGVSRPTAPATCDFAVPVLMYHRICDLSEREARSPLLRDLEELGEVWVEDRRAIIAVVGIGLRHTPGLAARVFHAVWPANVEVISQGCSSINMTFVVRQEDGPDVVRRLHREFFGSD